MDLRVMEAHWNSPPRREHPLAPPVSLLSWLIRNLRDIRGASFDDDAETARRRRRLIERDHAMVAEALGLLRRDPHPRGWHVLEGHTAPDAYIVARDALVVIEGKRTESAPAIGTRWLPTRHQMLRQIDAAWEIRGGRQVYGFFIVEGNGNVVDPPLHWIDASRTTISDQAIAGSLPHRGVEEREGIRRAFLGVTTWQAVCGEFGVSASVLRDPPPGDPRDRR
jgi:hypothetical protein